jgi:DNA-binding XRE family transcriptional regulator
MKLKPCGEISIQGENFFIVSENDIKEMEKTLHNYGEIEITGKKVSHSNLGLCLKKMRIEKNITQKELAEMLQITQCNISRWEIGQINPKKINLEKICNIFKCSIKELLQSEEK